MWSAWLLTIALGSNPGPTPDEGEKILSFYGLLELEKDAKVSDEEKLRRWQAFLERTARQREYARKAVERWRFAEAHRLLERAVAMDAGAASAQEKCALWRSVAQAFQGKEEADPARRRALHWDRLETKARVEAARQVEEDGLSKVDRIQAWKKVVAWAPDSEAGRTASQRISALQQRLVVEAQSLESVEGVDPATRIMAWKQVLAGAPTPKQAARAEARIAALSGS